MATSPNYPTSHKQLLSTIWGFDISPFAAELAVINMYRQDMSEFENSPDYSLETFLIVRVSRWNFPRAYFNWDYENPCTYSML